MRFHRFDLNLLVALDALLDERNVTKASERLNLGQSATSGALARLREYFGDELLVQVGRRMMLTPLALSLVEPVREALLQAQSVIAIQPSFDPATAERHFDVIASDYVLTTMLTEVMQTVAQSAPRITVDVRGPPPDFAEQLERGEIDFVFMPQNYALKEHPQLQLYSDDYVCIVCQHNTVVGNQMTFKQYMEMGHAAALFGKNRRVTLEDWFLQRYGEPRRIEVSTDHFVALPHLVMGTHRVATVQGRLARLYARAMPVRIVPLPFEMPPIVEVMQWHEVVGRDPAHRWLRGVFENWAAQDGSV